MHLPVQIVNLLWRHQVSGGDGQISDPRELGFRTPDSVVNTPASDEATFGLRPNECSRAKLPSMVQVQSCGHVNWAAGKAVRRLGIYRYLKRPGCALRR